MAVYALDEQDVDIVAHLPCCCCGAKVSLATLKHQLKEGFKWYRNMNTGANFCGYCSEELGLNAKVKNV